MALVELGRYVAGFEADIDRLRLEDAGIYAFVFDSGMGALVAGVRLMVDDEDEDAARALLLSPADSREGD